TYPEALIARDKVQDLWAQFPLGERLSACLEHLDPWRTPDLNARVTLAFGRSGEFTDQHGGLDPSRVFAAFADEDSPYEALAHKAWRYVQPHTGLSEEGDPATSVVLIGPLVMLAASERPLRAHRTARLFFEAARTAFTVDPGAVRQIGRLAAEEGPSIFGALKRVERAFSDLTADLSDEDALDRMLRAYRQLAETTFRTIGWLALSLEAIGAGKGSPSDSHPPMLGELQQRLAAGGKLARCLATGIDVNLRNAEAHVQYRWVPERQVVRDFRTGQEWTIDNLEAALHELIASLAGADTGYGCFFVANGLTEEIPAWFRDGVAPEVPELLASITFGAKGIEVVRVKDKGASVIIAPQAELDSTSLFPALAGLVPFADKADLFKVEDTQGALLVKVSGDAMRQSVKGPALFKDISVTTAFYDSAVRTGMDPKRAGREFPALISKSVAVIGLEKLVETELAPAAFRDLRDRLDYISKLARSPLPFEIDDAKSRIQQWRRVRSTAGQAARGNQAALNSLTKQLVQMASEVEDQGTEWPPPLPPSSPIRA
ncbi:MAG TPA: hypothetical protein VFZ19_07950, partial [Solirubrobacterales bacterium]